jgi:hypothetical protein
MWQKVHPSMNLECNEILVAGFVGVYYVVVLKNKIQELQYTVIVENIKTPLKITINAEYNRDGYHIFGTNQLEQLPKKLYQELNKRGLFMSEKDRSSYSALTSIHRLVSCIHDNCKGLPIHHIDKDKGNNCICNLVSVTEEINNEIEDLYTIKGKELEAKGKGRELWVKQLNIKKVREEAKKNYKTNNDYVQIDIIKCHINQKTKIVIKRFRRIIKTPQKIRDILNYFSYGEMFLKWLNSYSSRLYSKEYISNLLT